MKPKSAKEYWKEKFGEYPQNDAEKLAVVMTQEYAKMSNEERKPCLCQPAVNGELPGDYDR